VGLAAIVDPAAPGGRVSGAEGAPSATPVAPVVEAPPVLDSVEVLWVPESVPQGTVFEIRVSSGTAEPLDGAQGNLAGEPLHFQREDGGDLVALGAVPVDASGEVELALDIRGAGGTEGRRTYAVPVVAGDYRMERLTVAPEFGDPQPPEIQQRIAEESARAMAVSRASHGTPRMWQTPFVPPRQTRITSGFGHGRVFNEQVQSRHMGTDFAGAPGEPVLAPARGVVALVDSFYLGGNVIYIDHGAGLVTAYLHLSAHEVSQGDAVEPGQVIGRVGATGRVTGPHLHWIVRYGAITVDGLSLLALAGS
jgi:murein DD-endopeptidase MepM/ murein hydrolase activator NlpD